jgi:urease accessory protein
MPVSPGLLLLADSRLPAGGHAHSGGLEAAITAGAVTGSDRLGAPAGPGDVNGAGELNGAGGLNRAGELNGLAGPDGLELFLRGRLLTAGLVSAALAAAACGHAAQIAAGQAERWAVLAAEAAARTPSPAQRRASCAQGRSLLRVARAAWPSAALDLLAAAAGADGLYHPLVLGACAHTAGSSPADAAAVAATAAVTGPASAAVRLLGLDPLGVHRLLASLASDIESVTNKAAGLAAAGAADGDWAGLPAAASPGLDLLAEQHAREEVALFES